MKTLLKHVQFKKEAAWILCGLFFFLILINWPQSSAEASKSNLPAQQPPLSAPPIDSAVAKQSRKEARLQYRKAIVASIRQAGHPCEKFSRIFPVNATLEIYQVKCNDTLTYRMQFDHGKQGWVFLEKIFEQVEPVQGDHAQPDSLDLM